MAKKNLNIILIICVILIWSVLLFKFFKMMYVSSDDYVNNKVEVGEVSIPQISKDTFELKHYNKDPFLGKIKIQKQPTKTSNNKSGNSVKNKIDQKWPKIEYLGFIKQNNSNAPLLLLKIDGRLYRKKPDTELVEGLRITKFNKDSITVNYNQELKVYKQV